MGCVQWWQPWDAALVCIVRQSAQRPPDSPTDDCSPPRWRHCGHVTRPAVAAAPQAESVVVDDLRWARHTTAQVTHRTFVSWSLTSLISTIKTTNRRRAGVLWFSWTGTLHGRHRAADTSKCRFDTNGWKNPLRLYPKYFFHGTQIDLEQFILHIPSFLSLSETRGQGWRAILAGAAAGTCWMAVLSQCYLLTGSVESVIPVDWKCWVSVTWWLEVLSLCYLVTGSVESVLPGDWKCWVSDTCWLEVLSLCYLLTGSVESVIPGDWKCWVSVTWWLEVLSQCYLLTGSVESVLPGDWKCWVCVTCWLEVLSQCYPLTGSVESVLPVDWKCWVSVTWWLAVLSQWYLVTGSVESVLPGDWKCWVSVTCWLEVLSQCYLLTGSVESVLPVDWKCWVSVTCWLAVLSWW